ncbi:MAG: Trk system potassium transporter TrkA [Rubricoccaceae bacterium]
MRVIVVGAGDVGYDVARLLSQQRHDVTVVDKDPARVAHVRDTLDVLALTGSGTSAATLAAAGLAEADLLVAVTDSDEANVIAAMLAARAGRPGRGSPHGGTTTIARVRSDNYTGEGAVLTPVDFGIDYLVHPEETTAGEVVTLLRRAAATDVVPFCEGRLQLVGLRIEPGAAVVGATLSALAARAPAPFRVMGIVRGARTLVPSGADTVQSRDQVFVLVPQGQVGRVSHLFGKEPGRLRHAMILGGSSIGARVAAELSSAGRRGGGMQVKLVEADRARAEFLAETLPAALVLHGDPSDLDLLVREGLPETDAVVAVADDEESNLVSCLMAKHLGVRKTVALLSKSAYIPIAQSIGLDAAVNRKLAVSRAVLRVLRGGHVQSVATVVGLDAEILEFVAAPGAPVTRAPLGALGLPRGLLVGGVVHGRHAEVATGETRLHAGDRAVVFALPDRVADAERAFAA